jgi:hypothetical protein
MYVKVNINDTGYHIRRRLHFKAVSQLASYGEGDTDTPGRGETYKTHAYIQNAEILISILQV